MENGGTTERIRQNLLDAGCEEPLAADFLRLREAGKVQEQMRLLKKHRAALLRKVHENQKMIDCLDFLMFSMDHKVKVKVNGIK